MPFNVYIIQVTMFTVIYVIININIVQLISIVVTANVTGYLNITSQIMFIVFSLIYHNIKKEYTNM